MWDHFARLTPTPSAAAELTVWSLREYEASVRNLVRAATVNLQAMADQARGELRTYMTRPVFKRPLDMVYQYRQQLDNDLRMILTAGKNRFEKSRNRLSLALSRLDALSPLKTLARGFSVTRRADDGRLVKGWSEVAEGDRLETILAEGRVISVVQGRLEDLT